MTNLLLPMAISDVGSIAEHCYSEKSQEEGGDELNFLKINFTTYAKK